MAYQQPRPALERYAPFKSAYDVKRSLKNRRTEHQAAARLIQETFAYHGINVTLDKIVDEVRNEEDLFNINKMPLSPIRTTRIRQIAKSCWNGTLRFAPAF